MDFSKIEQQIRDGQWQPDGDEALELVKLARQADDGWRDAVYKLEDEVDKYKRAYDFLKQHLNWIKYHPYDAYLREYTEAAIDRCESEILNLEEKE